MELSVPHQFKFLGELRCEPNLSGMPLSSQDATDSLPELVEESYSGGVLAERLPVEPVELSCEIAPEFLSEPIVQQLSVRLTWTANGARMQQVQQFTKGRWWRSAQEQLARLYDEDVIQRDQSIYSMLLALSCRPGGVARQVQLAAVPIADQGLDAVGVRRLGTEPLCPDRPVLVNRRFVQDALRRCTEAGLTETGGAVLGKIVRLPEALPGARTRIVTVLTALVEDPRHRGAPLQFHFSPEALLEAADMAELRGLGESVQTVFHSHGWSPKCAGCTQNCVLPLAVPSLQDYQVLESLLPSKATLMPIAGRRRGTQDAGPVLEISAWRSGEMQPIRWRTYDD